MTKDEVLELVKGGESETLEFNSTAGDRCEAATAVCAMLNKRGGRVLFGVTPEGNAAGQMINEGTFEELKAEIDEIAPPADPVIERISVADNLEVISMRVEPSASNVHQYRGIAYHRIGSINAIMSPHEFGELYSERTNSFTRWDAKPATGWTLADLDELEVQKTIFDAVREGRLEQANRESVEDMLCEMDLLHDGIPTRAAAVLFGKEEKLGLRFPQCVIRAARFKGREMGDFLDNQWFEGNAFTILSSAERFLLNHNPVAGHSSHGSITRKNHSLYPAPAVREAIANALCHREYNSGSGGIGLAVYDDRVEITSSGPLKFGLTPKSLFRPHASKQRNPLIARVFYLRGIIEGRGSGIGRMAEMSLSAGLPRPEIKDSGIHVTVRFWGSQGMAKRSMLSAAEERRDAVIAVLERANNGMPASEVLKRMPFGVTYRQVRRTLSELGSNNVAIASGQGPRTRWKLLSDDGMDTTD